MAGLLTEAKRGLADAQLYGIALYNTRLPGQCVQAVRSAFCPSGEERRQGNGAAKCRPTPNERATIQYSAGHSALYAWDGVIPYCIFWGRRILCGWKGRAAYEEVWVVEATNVRIQKLPLTH